MVVFGFPGQGSQIKGMGDGLFERFPQLTERADEILGYSIRDLCVDDFERRLSSTEFTQPALYVVNILSYLQHLSDTSIKPDYLIGHSLGEYCALFAAGAFNFEDGLRIVKKRGALMGSLSNGSMAASIGCDVTSVKKILEEHNLLDIDVANINSPTQVVLSGSKDSITNAEQYFHAVGATYIPLNVSAAFHSRLMRPILDEFSTFLSQFTFSSIDIPVISNIDANPYRNDQIIETLTRQISGSVQWNDSVRLLMGLGDFTFKEIGPGNVLTKLVASIQAGASPIFSPSVNTHFDHKMSQENFNATEKVAEAEKNTGDENPSGGNSERQMFTAENLGSNQFKRDYNIRYAYLTGSMYKGIASEVLVIKMARAGLLGFFGTGGMALDMVERAIINIRGALAPGQSYGVNLLHQPSNFDGEMKLVDILLMHSVRNVEASAFMQITPALVKYRLTGLYKDAHGNVRAKNRIIAKISRPEVAKVFLNPAPERIVRQLRAEKLISIEEAEFSQYIPMAEDLCAESDSGGHTDLGVASVLLPTIKRLRDRVCQVHSYSKTVRVGAAGGIGTPEAVAAAFVLGADFVVTGSINQCTVEAGTSDKVKQMLQDMDIQDTAYAPAGDMFELGAKVQVLRRGVFFPARANKLYDLWFRYNSLSQLDEQTRNLIEEKYFKRSFDQVYEEVKSYYLKVKPDEIEKAEINEKHKMALIFKWYFVQTSRLALSGDENNQVDFQVHTGPAMGAFNQWVKGTKLESWQNRNVDVIAETLMVKTAEYLNDTLLGCQQT